MGGGKKKKEKEQSFKRSDSFKRISIRKSYLDRGGKKRQPQKQVTSTAIIHEEKIEEKIEEVKPLSKTITEITHDPNESKEGVGQSVKAYGNWLRGVRVTEPNVTCTVTKGAERTIIYIPASDDPSPIPIIRQLSASPITPRRRPSRTSPALKRKESNDSAVEMFPWGESIDLQKSPILRRTQLDSSPPPQSLLPDTTGGSEELCSLSVSLGRIWMDAPLAMSPRSLELPRPSPSNVVPPPAHHSLDSALKDRRDEPVTNRLQKKQTPPVTRTLSTTSSATASTGLFSSKDSGFSLSAPKLDEFSSPSSKGFFRKKRPQPKLSVSRDGYFKRTSGGLFELKRNSVKRKSSRKKKARSSGRRKKVQKNFKNDMYQVVVSRPPRCLKSLKLDPMIFVPPEKRKPSVRRAKSFKLTVQEIRESTFKEVDTHQGIYSGDEGLYETISGEATSEHYYDVPSNDFRDSSDNESVVVVSDNEDNTSAKSSSGSAGSFYMPPPVVTGIQNRVRRRKSVSRKKSITFVAKPNILRAPSTLRRSKKKTKSKFLVSFIWWRF